MEAGDKVTLHRHGNEMTVRSVSPEAVICEYKDAGGNLVSETYDHVDFEPKPAVVEEESESPEQEAEEQPEPDENAQKPDEAA